jgi:uncharacterized repeat protein (TIGR03803 family)
MRSVFDSDNVVIHRRVRFLTPRSEVLEPRCLLNGHVGRLEPVAHHARAAQTAYWQPTAEISSRVVSSLAREQSKTPSDKVLHNFGGMLGGVPDGWQPWGSLTPVQTSSGSIIFGRTLFGGPSGDGIIFTMKPDGKGYTIVHSFSGGVNDGSQPHHDQLRQEGNVLYGATLMGGSTGQGEGVVFSINTNGGGFQILHRFMGGKHDGEQPHSNPMPDGSVLYGLTAKGGAKNQGTIYKLNTDGNGFKVLYSFRNCAGTQPHGFVVIDGHDLFGMTRKGGKAGDGTIFEFDVKTKKYTVLHHFKGGKHDGATPDHGGLVQVGKTLYGLTTEGGKQNDGVLFSIDTSGKHFQILHTFSGGKDDGSGPHGSLTLVGSTLYGMTSDGGKHNDGTIFQIDTSGLGYQTIYSFAGPTSDGKNGLDNVFILDGNIYGMTKYGGSMTTPGSSAGSPAYDNGVIFTIPLPGSSG